jgi:thiol:disulfide interchange protein
LRQAEKALRRDMAMATNRQSGTQKISKGLKVWLGIGAFVLIAACVATYFLTRSSPQPAPPGIATAPSSIGNRHIYSETADPPTDIAAALKQAKSEHKRVILDFGGDWCGDCQVLDIYFHQPPNGELLEKNFVLVHVWIGHMDTNIDVAAKYGVPISRGVPALAVLSADGKVLYSQATGEFADMRHMDPGSLTEFLNKWTS